MSEKRGFVFRDEDDTLTLLTIDPVTKEIEENTISDEDHVYTDLPAEKTEVVEIDGMGENIGIVVMKSICCVSFTNEADEVCPARVAIRGSIPDFTEQLEVVLYDDTKTDYVNTGRKRSDSQGPLPPPFMRS